MVLESADSLGPLVLRADVETFAKSGCTSCYGRGILVMYTRTPGLAHGLTPVEHLCRCASKRFIKAFGSRVAFDENKQLRWRKEEQTP